MPVAVEHLRESALDDVRTQLERRTGDTGAQVGAVVDDGEVGIVITVPTQEAIWIPNTAYLQPALVFKGGTRFGRPSPAPLGPSSPPPQNGGGTLKHGSPAGP